MKCQRLNCKFNLREGSCMKENEVVFLTRDNQFVCSCYKKEEVKDCKYVINLFHSQRTDDYTIIVTFLEENPKDSSVYYNIDRDIFSIQGNATELVSNVYFDYFMTTGIDSTKRFKRGTLTFDKVKDIGVIDTKKLDMYTLGDLYKFANEVVDTYRLRHYLRKQ